jgi:hypothetical protein
MSIEEVLCQISTFLAAGHETTCSALTWCLYALGKDQRVQLNLRDAFRRIQDQMEVENCDDEAQDYQEILTNQVLKCDYLDWVVRECLRLHAPVTNTMRVCLRDYDEIPLSNHHPHANQSPVALGNSLSETHRLGSESTRNTRQTIPIRKWDIISIPIQAINKGEMFWGEDAGIFRCGFLFLLISCFFFLVCPGVFSGQRVTTTIFGFASWLSKSGFVPNSSSPPAEIEYTFLVQSLHIPRGVMSNLIDVHVLHRLAVFI